MQTFGVFAVFPCCTDIDLVNRVDLRLIGGRSDVAGWLSAVSMSWEHFRYNHLRVVPNVFNDSPRLFDRVNEASRSAPNEPAQRQRKDMKINLGMCYVHECYVCVLVYSPLASFSAL